MKQRLNLKQGKKPSASRGNGEGSARAQLLGAARRLFARKGLTGTSIRDIAQAAKLNSSLISYYFQSKEGLYTACVEEIARSSLEMTKKVLQPPATEAEYRVRLQLFLDETFALFLEDRDTGLILIREYDRVHSPAEEIFRASLIDVMDLIVQFFRKAQQSGILDSSRDPVILAHLFFGCVTSQMRMDHFREKTFGKSLLDSKEKRKIENHIVDLFSIPPKNNG